MKEFIFQSPKRDNPNNHPHRSDWVREDDVTRIGILSGKGWKVVEEREHVEPVTSPGVFVVERAPGFGEGLGVVGETTFGADAYELTDAQFDALVEAGYADEKSLRDATDDDLRGVPGIGPAAVRNIRKALAAPGSEPEA